MGILDHVVSFEVREGKGRERRRAEKETSKIDGSLAGDELSLTHSEELKHKLHHRVSITLKQEERFIPWCQLVACGLPQSRKRKPQGPQMQHMYIQEQSLIEGGELKRFLNIHSQLEKHRLFIFE